VLLASTMKKGRPGVRLEVLTRPAEAATLERLLLTESTSIGVRRVAVERRALPRRMAFVDVLGHRIGVKLVTLPDGSTRAKPEFDDVLAAARTTGRPPHELVQLAVNAAQGLQ
jgi:uncharacterized protein (DUF111 family)